MHIPDNRILEVRDVTYCIECNVICYSSEFHIEPIYDGVVCRCGEGSYAGADEEYHRIGEFPEKWIAVKQVIYR